MVLSSSTFLPMTAFHSTLWLTESYLAYIYTTFCLFVLLLLLCFVFETGSHYVVLASLKLTL